MVVDRPSGWQPIYPSVNLFRNARNKGNIVIILRIKQSDTYAWRVLHFKCEVYTCMYPSF